MWGTISRLFATKPRSSVRSPEPGEEAVAAAEEEERNYYYYNNSDPACKNLNGVPQAELAVHVFKSMDRNMGDDRRPKGGPGDHGVTDNEHFSDAYDTRQAKQRASVKWLLSKAYNNRVPDNLREPYYRDMEDQEHLKPQIVHALSNAELYCLALANIYSDPNYHNQNHWGILQALARKGVYVAEPNNSQLTETILIQNSPLKMSAHMAVIEGLMVLYAKEVVTGDRVVAAIRRFDPQPEIEVPSDHEKGLLMWISHASHALIAKIQTEEGAGDKTRLPELPAAKDFQSLCDGVGLAAVVAFYCPGELNWMDIKVSKRPSVADALHNLSLVHNFCIRCLPYSIFHMQPEDVTYMRGSMKQNLLVFLADMYNVLEIHPVKCVRYPGEERAMQYLDACPRNSHGVAHKRSLPQAIAPIPDLRSNLSVSAPGFTVGKPIPSSSVRKSQSLQQTAESHSYDDRRAGSEENFIVHRNRGIPTLSSVIDDKYNNTAAGRPSNWEDQRRSSYAGRRSRRNSVTDDSQLTIENFGGSQDNLHNFGCVRNPDKELVHTGKRTVTEPTLPARSSVQDAYGSDVQNILADNGYGNDDLPPTRLRRQISNSNLNNSSHKNVLHSTDNNNDNTDSEIKTTANTSATKMSSFANLTQHNSEKSINFKYTEQQEHDELSANKVNYNNKKFGQSNGNGIGEKKTTFATLPNTTTWQQQSAQQSQQLEQQSADENGGNTMVYAAQINNIKMKLEEKRRLIENEKRRMEVVVSKQRQKVGKAAFLQAVTKEITEDIHDVEHKWLEQDGSAPFTETRRTPDIENMDFDQCQQSISHMNSTLNDIQVDIQRLASQQNQIQQQTLMTQQQQQIHQQLQELQSLRNQQQHLQSYGMPPISPMTPRLADTQPGQFYLHDQPQQMQRRTWGRPAHQQNLVNEMASVGHYQPQPVVDPHYSPQPVAAASVIYQQDPRLYQDTRTWGTGAIPQQKGFVLHDNTQEQQQYQPRYLNGGDHSLCNSQMHQPIQNYPSAALFNQTPPTAASPQHRNAVHRISQLINESPETKKSTIHHVPITCESPTDKRQNNINIHTPVPAPPVDDMEPQNISFIGNDDDFTQGIKRLHITSGSRTYRIASPTKTTISRNSFQPHSSLREASPSPTSAISPPEITPLDSSDAGEKGFYISFDNDGPKKPKPALRVKRSPKKERTVSSFIEQEDFTARPESPPANPVDRQRQLEAQRDLERERQRQAEEREYHRQEMRDRELRREIDKEQRAREDRLRTNSESRQNAANAVGLVIGNQLANPDPNSVDEMERKKERIMLLSLQRRQQQEELKERKEAEAQARREQEKMKEEERSRKKEEDRQRRAMILEQHKLKKAIEEAEREGKVIDKELLNAIKPTPKLRNKTASARPRPKTIHVDQSSEIDSGALTPSRGKKGSSSNLSTVSSVDSPDDGRGCSPCRSSTQLGRRGSYKTSRDTQEPQQQPRGRPKYSTYQNFKGRKSNSLMNLCDTDSGLGRATPPRRAPSPGMGSTKHLPSPSGPGSLPPGLMSKRRFDDGSSDISSTPSSMMEYNGPRLYKQPATKSNRGIMLNAVEYCVFPGSVNKESKRRVLEEIGRSESKHFLILFRDAGCQFRALYSYCPDKEEVNKLCGTGPKQVLDNMFDKFFKYNSGGKCFSQVHTKHLTVTIDAFTIHNSLWQGKKVNLPNKKDMALVI